MPRFERKNQGSSHSYLLDGLRIPGVTTVIGILDKPALVNWAARESAIYADENWARLSSMRSADRVDAITKARWAKNKAAVIKGNRIHALGDKLARGVEVEVPIEFRSQVEAYARFLDAWEIEAIATETPVANTEYRYGGTFDLITRSPRLGVSLADIKTGSGVYDEVGLQLNAYADCDLRLVEREVIGPRGGRSTAWDEAPMIDVETLWVAHVREDVVDMRPVKRDPAITDTFLYLLEIYETWTKRVGWDFRAEESYDPPVGKTVFVEDVPRRTGAVA